jgi:hypothetical protein
VASASAPSLATLRTDLRRQRVIIDQHQATLDAQFRRIAALQMDIDLLTTDRPAAPADRGEGSSRRRSEPVLLSPPGQLRRIPAARVPDDPAAAASPDDGRKRRVPRARRT